MSTLPAAQPSGGTNPTDRDPQQLAAAIRRSVLGALGHPQDFLKVTVRQVSSQNYRVNVVAGSDVVSARITDSFFVVVDDRGNVTESNPAIRKLY